jgi:hypothetical protein
VGAPKLGSPRVPSQRRTDVISDASLVRIGTRMLDCEQYGAGAGPPARARVARGRQAQMPSDAAGDALRSRSVSGGRAILPAGRIR